MKWTHVQVHELSCQRCLKNFSQLNMNALNMWFHLALLPMPSSMKVCSRKCQGYRSSLLNMILWWQLWQSKFSNQSNLYLQTCQAICFGRTRFAKVPLVSWKDFFGRFSHSVRKLFQGSLPRRRRPLRVRSHQMSGGHKKTITNILQFFFLKKPMVFFVLICNGCIDIVFFGGRWFYFKPQRHPKRCWTCLTSKSMICDMYLYVFKIIICFCVCMWEIGIVSLYKRTIGVLGHIHLRKLVRFKLEK